MNKELQQQNNDEEVLAELDRFVIEAIDTLIATSRQVKSVRQRQQSEQRSQTNEMSVNKVTKLKPRFSAEDDVVRHSKQQDDVFQETLAVEENKDDQQHVDDLAGMTSRQREHAEAFAGWLIQQDNYPIILQHVEELLAVMEDDFSWNDPVGDKKQEIKVQKQLTGSDSEESEDEDKSGSGE